MSELRQIRDALNLSQEEMGALYGVKQGTYQRWEASPNAKASREALDRATALYKKKTGKDWIGPIDYETPTFLRTQEDAKEPPSTAGLANEVAELRGVVEAMRKDLKQVERVQFALIGAIRQLAKVANLPHLEEIAE